MIQGVIIDFKKLAKEAIETVLEEKGLMSYESPIKIIERNITKDLEDNVHDVIMSYGIDVNREELLKALNYDRDQYEKGYRDGKNDRFNSSVKPFKTGNRWRCGECSTAVGRFWVFCQKCGLKINWEGAKNETN